MAVMSGFRTPQYNATGGDTTGRDELSRHMFGDASDVFVDNDGDGRMDDLNGDGRIDYRDAQVIVAGGHRTAESLDRGEQRFAGRPGATGGKLFRDGKQTRHTKLLAGFIEGLGDPVRIQQQQVARFDLHGGLAVPGAGAGGVRKLRFHSDLSPGLFAGD